MPRCVFLLGPDHWDDGHEVPWPAWATRQSKAAFTPKALRFEMAAAIERESDKLVDAVVMEDALRPHPHANDADTFRHIEVSRGVDAYFIVVPDRAKVLGTIFEGGMLVRDHQFGRAPRVALFLESSYAEPLDDGDYAFAKGKRTRYLNSLVDVAEHVQTWRSMGEAVEQVLSWALV